MSISLLETANSLLLVVKAAPLPFDWMVFWTAVASTAAAGALAIGIVGLVRSGRSERKADAATLEANRARDESATQAKRSADELAEANRLFERATGPKPWAVQFTDRTHFQLVNMTGKSATDVIAVQAAENPAAGFGMVLGENGTNRADPGRGIDFAWYLGDDLKTVLAVKLNWRSGPEGTPFEDVIFVDRRPNLSAIERFDSALADVMAALQRRHVDLIGWARVANMIPTGNLSEKRLIPPGEQLGGPSDADLQTSVDIAAMRATIGTERAVDALLSCTFALKQGRVDWQKKVAGEVAGLIRKWRTQEISEADFIAELERIATMAKDQHAAYSEEYPNF